MNVAVSLPSATAVASATNHGQPIVLSKPEHPVSRAISRSPACRRRAVGAARAARQARPVRAPEEAVGIPMSSLSDRLAALNRGNEAAAAPDDGRRGGRAPHRSGAPTYPRMRLPPTSAYPTSPPRPGQPGHSAGGPTGPIGSSGASQIRPGQAGGQSAASTASRAEAAKDRFEDLKESVHSELLQQLGPQLYDANLEAAELESKVRTVLADVLAASNRPLTRGDRERITQEIADDILGYGPLEPYLRDADVAEVMVNGPFGHLARAQGQAGQGRRQVQGRGAPAPHHRQDRLAHRPPRRRVVPHGRRPAARRQPRQRRRAAAGDRRQRR